MFVDCWIFIGSFVFIVFKSIWETRSHYSLSNPCVLMTLALLPHCLESHRPQCCMCRNSNNCKINHFLFHSFLLLGP